MKINTPRPLLLLQAILETGQSSQSLHIVFFFLPMMFFSARLAMSVTTITFVLALFVLPLDIDVQLGKLG